MSTPTEPHPAGQGLANSGYVVSVVRSVADMQMTMLYNDGYISITLPGRPCGVMVCCSAQGAEALADRLADGLSRLRSAEKKSR